jgi:hypothetical protein
VRDGLGSERRRYADVRPAVPGASRLEQLQEVRAMERPVTREDPDVRRFWGAIPFDAWLKISGPTFAVMTLGFGVLWNGQQQTTQRIIDLEQGTTERILRMQEETTAKILALQESTTARIVELQESTTDRILEMQRQILDLNPRRS